MWSQIAPSHSHYTQKGASNCPIHVSKNLPNKYEMFTENGPNRLTRWENVNDPQSVHNCLTDPSCAKILSLNMTTELSKLMAEIFRIYLFFWGGFAGGCRGSSQPMNVTHSTRRCKPPLPKARLGQRAGLNSLKKFRTVVVLLIS